MRIVLHIVKSGFRPEIPHSLHHIATAIERSEALRLRLLVAGRRPEEHDLAVAAGGEIDGRSVAHLDARVCERHALAIEAPNRHRLCRSRIEMVHV